MLFDYAKTIIQERDIYGPEQTLNTAGVGQFYFGRVGMRTKTWTTWR